MSSPVSVFGPGNQSASVSSISALVSGWRSRRSTALRGSGILPPNAANTSPARGPLSRTTAIAAGSRPEERAKIVGRSGRLDMTAHRSGLQPSGQERTRSRRRHGADAQFKLRWWPPSPDGCTSMSTLHARWIGCARAAALLLIATSGIACAAEFKILAGSAVEPAMNQLIPAFEKASGHTVTHDFNGAIGEMTKRVLGGEAADVVIVSATQIDTLLEAGTLLRGSRTDIAKV